MGKWKMIETVKDVEAMEERGFVCWCIQEYVDFDIFMYQNKSTREYFFAVKIETDFDQIGGPDGMGTHYYERYHVIPRYDKWLADDGQFFDIYVDESELNEFEEYMSKEG